jgi:VanZ family protein
MRSSEPGTTSPAVTEVIERAIRTGIAVFFAEGLRKRSPGAVVNALVAFGGAHLPAILERRPTVKLRPWQRIYVETAMLTHAAGMLGPYDDIWWWDHLTHIHSSTVLGGLIHVRSRRLGVDPKPRVVTGVVTMGVLWEVMEYIVHVASRRVGLEPILVSYGKTDTLLDLVSNLVGAVLVLVFGDALLGNLLRPEND